MNPQKLVLWVIWTAFVSSIFIFRLILGVNEPKEIALDALGFALLIGPMGATVFVRWLLIPKAKSYVSVTPLFIAGMAISESINFFGLFMFSYFQDVYFAIALVAALQFFPGFINIGSEGKDHITPLSKYETKDFYKEE